VAFDKRIEVSTAEPDLAGAECDYGQLPVATEPIDGLSAATQVGTGLAHR